ncbi:MAG: ABC transporter permease [Halanaerobiaceae bacterium]
MLNYILKRFTYMLILVIVMSFLTFIIINLPPGDYLTTYVNRLKASGTSIDQSAIRSLERRYGLGKPFHLQYYGWVKGMFRGDFGDSFSWGRPVLDMILNYLPYTVLLVLSSTIFVYLVSIPIAIYSATHQYSIGDYLATTFGFLGLAIPNFLFALVLMYFLYTYMGIETGGLLSQEYQDAAWNIDKIINLFQHLIPAVIVIGTAGTAGLIRTLRGTMLDEINKLYVTVARSKGLAYWRLLFKYPVRIALNPVLSSIGYILPQLVSGGAIVSIVLNLPTLGSVLYNALLSQDMYLAGTIILFQTILIFIGTFISDMLLVWSDPRIKFE